MQEMHIVNDHGISITIKAEVNMLTEFQQYYLINSSLKKLKNLLSIPIKTNDVYKPPTFADTMNEMSKHLVLQRNEQVIGPLLATLSNIEKEMTNVSAQDGWKNNCGQKTPCTVTMAAWKAEANHPVFKALFLAQSVMYSTSQTPTVTITQNDASYTSETDKKVRTILGVGPSGCGKSYLAKQLFPCIPGLQTVVSNDGGTVRECSNAWMAATTLKPQGRGVSNFYDVFKNASNPKKVFDAYFSTVKYSLYIPDTLVSLYFSVGLTDKIANWIKNKGTRFQGDTSIEELPYVGILIMQHCDSCNSPCPFTDIYKCIGCDTSGNKRAITEGKKWENTKITGFGDTYKVAMDQGYDATMKSQFPIFVHNSGFKDHKSIIVHNTPFDYKTLSRSCVVVKTAKFQARFSEFEQDLVNLISRKLEIDTALEINNQSRAAGTTDANYVTKAVLDAALGELMQKVQSIKPADIDGRTLLQSIRPEIEATVRSAAEGLAKQQASNVQQQLQAVTAMVQRFAEKSDKISVSNFITKAELPAELEKSAAVLLEAIRKETDVKLAAAANSLASRDNFVTKQELAAFASIVKQIGEKPAVDTANFVTKEDLRAVEASTVDAASRLDNKIGELTAKLDGAVAPKTKRPSFFSRLFSRKARPTGGKRVKTRRR